MSLTVEQRALRWVTGRHVGLSSECIWRTMMGVPESTARYGGGDYPLDPDDFWRCRWLLKLIPEWRPRMGEMAKHGPVWARLAARWDEIEALFVEEVGDEPKRGAMATRTYALMKEIEDAAA